VPDSDRQISESGPNSGGRRGHAHIPLQWLWQRPDQEMQDKPWRLYSDRPPAGSLQSTRGYLRVCSHLAGDLISPSLVISSLSAVQRVRVSRNQRTNNHSQLASQSCIWNDNSWAVVRSRVSCLHDAWNQ